MTGLRLALLFTFFVGIAGFVSPIDSQRRCHLSKDVGSRLYPNRSIGGKSDMRMSNIFDDIQNFFSEFGNDNSKNDNDDSQNENATNENRIVTIPVKAIKPGGLRLFLMFYLMGVQNIPHPNAWKADQPSKDDYVIDCYFHDRTAMLTIELQEEEITIDRIGTVPSTAYSMQETVIVEGILDELYQCAFDEEIEEQNRLLQLTEPKDAIDKARAALSFG